MLGSSSKQAKNYVSHVDFSQQKLWKIFLIEWLFIPTHATLLSPIARTSLLS